MRGQNRRELPGSHRVSSEIEIPNDSMINQFTNNLFCDFPDMFVTYSSTGKRSHCWASALPSASVSPKAILVGWRMAQAAEY